MTTINKRATVRKSGGEKRKSPVRGKKTAKKKKRSAYFWPLRLTLAGIVIILLSPLYYGYILKGFNYAFGWIEDIGENPNYRPYDSFDIRIPRKYSIHGIDVSSYQGKIDWQKVRNMEDNGVRIRFAFIKATEGLFLVDPYFQRNWREGPKAGITCGAYHYFKPKKNGKLQARFFLQNVKIEKGDLPMMVDVEELNGTTPARMREELGDFLDYIEVKTKVRPIVYSGLSFYRDYLRGHFDDYPLWIAHYYRPELVVDGTTRWSFWQHSDKARVYGINHPVDFNVFRGDSAKFESMLIR